MPTRSLLLELEKGLNSKALCSTSEVSALKKVLNRWGSQGGRSDNPDMRLAARYGFARTKTKQDVNAAAPDILSDTKQLAPTLARVWRDSLLATAPQIGILGSFHVDSSLDVKPTEVDILFPHASHPQARVDGWKQALANKAKTWTLVGSATADIGRDILVLINPFGECYPELPTGNRYPGYAELKSYVYAGGILVLPGGHPFHYYWDVKTGDRVDTSFVTPINRRITVDQFPSGHISVDILRTIDIKGLWLARDFGVNVLWDEEQSGPLTCTCYQEEVDKAVWDIGQPTQLHVFRPAIPQSCSPDAHIRPVVRCKLQDGREVWPVATAQYGQGLLLLIGLELSTSYQLEVDITFRLLAEGILCNLTKLF